MRFRSSSVSAAAHSSRSFSWRSFVGQPNQALSPFAAWAEKLIGFEKASPVAVVEKMLAALRGRLLHCAPVQHRAPVARGEVDVDPGLAQPLRHEQPGRI